MSKGKKIVIITVSVIVIACLIGLAASFWGNPISHLLVKHNATAYIQQEYPNTDYTVSNVSFNFKDRDYYATINSPSSPDSSFSACFSAWGKFKCDTYIDRVVKRYNTYIRLNSEYSQMLNEVFTAEDFPYQGSIAGGSLRKFHDADTDSLEKDFGLRCAELELDKQYDVKELAETCGSIVFYAYDDDVSIKRACNILLDIRSALNKADIPFYAITFVLQKPKNEDGSPNADSSRIHITDFLYSDLYAYELADRVEAAAAEMDDYFAQVDEKSE